jgi:hypothetical protein
MRSACARAWSRSTSSTRASVGGPAEATQAPRDGARAWGESAELATLFGYAEQTRQLRTRRRDRSPRRSTARGNHMGAVALDRRSPQRYFGSPGRRPPPPHSSRCLCGRPPQHRQSREMDGGGSRLWRCAVLSHRSAAALWKIGPVIRLIDVTVASSAGRAAPNGIRIHRSRTLSPANCTCQAGIPVTKPARTLEVLRRILPAGGSLGLSERRSICVCRSATPSTPTAPPPTWRRCSSRWFAATDFPRRRSTSASIATWSISSGDRSA